MVNSWQAFITKTATVPLLKIKVFISGPCTILDLTTVLGHLRRADAKKYLSMLKTIRGQTANYYGLLVPLEVLPEKMQYKNT